MSAASELLIVAPPAKRAAAKRAERELIGFLRRSFPRFCFTLAQDGPALASDAGGFAILPVLGSIGDEGAVLSAWPDRLVLLDVKEALDSYAFEAGAVH